MMCKQQCQRRLLLEKRLKREDLESLDELHSRISQHQCQQIRDSVRRSDNCEGEEDPFVLVIVQAFLTGALEFFVLDESSGRAYQISRSAIEFGCCSLSITECVQQRSFITKPSLMRHNSIEARSDGRPLYVRSADVNRLWQPRPASEKEVLEAILQYYDHEIEQPTNKKLVAHVKASLPLRKVSERRVLRLAKPLKPEAATRPGPRPRTKP